MDSSRISPVWNRFSPVLLLLSTPRHHHPHTHTPTHIHTHKHTHTSAPIASCLNFYHGSHYIDFKTFSHSSDKETRDLFCPWQPTRGCLLHFCFTNGEGRDPDSTLQLPVCDKGGQLNYMSFQEALVWNLEG